MTYLLDTNTVSYIVNGRSKAAREAYQSARETSSLCISSITEAEVLFGLAQRANPGLTAAVKKFLATLEVLPCGSDEAAAYALLRSDLKRSGKVLSSLDLLIASHAISTGAILVSTDKAFAHVGNLVGLEDWATDL